MCALFLLHCTGALQRCHADVVLVSGLGVTPEGLVPQSIHYCGRCWCSLVQLLSASCANIRLGGIGRQTSCCHFWASKQQLFYICNTALPIEVDCECWVNTKATIVKSCIALLLYMRVFVVVLCVCHSLSFHKTGNMRKYKVAVMTVVLAWILTFCFSVIIIFN